MTESLIRPVTPVKLMLGMTNSITHSLPDSSARGELLLYAPGTAVWVYCKEILRSVQKKRFMTAGPRAWEPEFAIAWRGKIVLTWFPFCYRPPALWERAQTSPERSEEIQRRDSVPLRFYIILGQSRAVYFHPFVICFLPMYFIINILFLYLLFLFDIPVRRW